MNFNEKIKSISHRKFIIWVLILTVALLLISLLSPHMDRSLGGVIALLPALLFVSFLTLGVFLLIANIIVEFIEADNYNRLRIIISFLIALAFLLPRILTDFGLR